MGRPGPIVPPAAVPAALTVPWCTSHAEGTLLQVQAQPRASRAELVGVHGDAVKIRIPGAPVDGQANAELQRFLAEVLDLAKSAVVLQRGATGRRKQFLLRGLAPAEAARRLGLG